MFKIICEYRVFVRQRSDFSCERRNYSLYLFQSNNISSSIVLIFVQKSS